MTLNEDLTKLSLLLANNRKTKILVGYRVCRVQRYVSGLNGAGWYFTLPADNFMFKTQQQATDHLRTHHALRSADSFFAVQAVYNDGTVQEQPDSEFEPQSTPLPSSHQDQIKQEKLDDWKKRRA
ncbi:MAG: hypothetical protein DMG41_38025 [Acidobacteria bacterium]|nr:MAG: hypothetical protein DMG41_38025 [Acidobacteriota bacterium]